MKLKTAFNKSKRGVAKGMNWLVKEGKGAVKTVKKSIKSKRGKK